MEKQHGHIQRMCAIVFPGLLKMTPVLLMVFGVAWAMSVGSRVTLRPGEVLVKCSLSKDVWQTKHGVVIRGPSHSGDDHPVTVFDCDWLADNPDTPDCISHYGFTLKVLGKDSVMVSVPRTLLQNGSYQCLLVPQDKKAFTTCLVPPDDAEDPPTTISAVTPSTAADQPQPRDQKGANGDHPWGLVAAVVALSFTVFILLLMVIFMAVPLLRLKIYRKRSYSFSSDDDLILRAKRREEEEKKNEVEKQRLMTHTPVYTWGHEHVQGCVPAATCEAEGARQATKPDSVTSST